jgi:glycosyltransferase involved in cell wall biosynthesis
VVSTAVGGVRSAVLDGKTGRIISTDDDEAMARAIRRYLEDRVEGREHGAHGRRHVEETFALTALVRALDGLYRRLLER